MFAGDIVSGGEKLERRRYVLERRGMKVSCRKTEFMCVNKREASRTARI